MSNKFVDSTSLKKALEGVKDYVDNATPTLPDGIVSSDNEESNADNDYSLDFSKVVANPTTSDTDETLSSISIDGTNYVLGGAGGGGTLYKHECFCYKNSQASTSFTLVFFNFDPTPITMNQVRDWVAQFSTDTYISCGYGRYGSYYAFAIMFEKISASGILYFTIITTNGMTTTEYVNKCIDSVREV